MAEFNRAHQAVLSLMEKNSPFAHPIKPLGGDYLMRKLKYILFVIPRQGCHLRERFPLLSDVVEGESPQESAL